jgi:phage tail-like protein
MAFRYEVILDSGQERICGFTDVTGLGAETEVQTLREGGRNHAEVQLPGSSRFPSRLVLKTGLADRRLLWAWYVQIMRGAITRKDVTVVVKSLDGEKSSAWTFRRACPVKWTGPELHASTSAVAFESIELVHHGFLLSPGPPG